MLNNLENEMKETSKQALGGKKNNRDEWTQLPFHL